MVKSKHFTDGARSEVGEVQRSIDCSRADISPTADLTDKVCTGLVIKGVVTNGCQQTVMAGSFTADRRREDGYS